MRAKRFIRTFADISADDIPLVGGKNAALGELYRELRPRGVPIPNGFIVTADAYRHVLTEAGAWEALHDALDGVDPGDVADLAKRGRRARELVYSCELSEELRREILEAYAELEQSCGPELSVAIRSSATAEDLPDRELRGPAGDVSERERECASSGQLPALFCESIH